ncbi:hypothetical protein Trydic_g5573 [Trypoxylus dichotomus]
MNEYRNITFIMNYKNWDNRRGNRGRGRSNVWNWRGRGHHRIPMANTFIPNMGWSNTSTNYNQYHLPHHEPNGYYYSRHSKTFSSPINTISNILTKSVSPLPGSEEYTQNKIQQTSDLIKRQLNIDSETCSANESDFPSNLNYNECSNYSETLLHDDLSTDSSNRLVDNRRTVKQSAKRSKSPELIDVQEIHDKIIKHISNLSYSKKMNLVNQSTSGYDIAIQEVQRQKRLELSRALRDISKRQTQSRDDGEVINAIIPDIGIKIEDLPNDIIAELSNSLNLHLDDQIPCLVDPEACFKQAEEILNVNCFEGDDAPDMKFFEHNLIMNQNIANQMGDGTEPFPDLTKSTIRTLNDNLLKLKLQPQYPLTCNTNFQDNNFQESHASTEIQINDSFMEMPPIDAISQDGNERNDDEYARELDFNNFCFENFDFNKSYLVPTKPQPQDFVSENITGITPKISVRKDILLETDTINDITQSMEKPEVINFPGVNLPLNVESSLENSKFVGSNDIPHSHIQIPSFQETVNHPNNEPNSSDLNSIETDSNASRNSSNLTGNLQNPDFSSHVEETNLTLGQHEKTIFHDAPSQIGNQASPSVNQIPQSLEYCTQKRWKSPGEKKMMADIQGKASVIVNTMNMNIESKQNYTNLDNTVQNQIVAEIQPPCMDKTGQDIEKTNEPVNNSGIEVKSCQERIIGNEYLNTRNELKEIPFNIKLSAQDEPNLSINKESFDQSIRVMGLDVESVEKLQEAVSDQKSPKGEPKLMCISSKPKTDVSEKSQNTKQRKTKPISSKNTPKTSNKNAIKDFLEDDQINEFNSKNMLSDMSTKNNSDSDVNIPKEHRKVKTAAEKKGTVPISKTVTTIATQTKLSQIESESPKLTRSVHIQTMLELKSKSDNSESPEKHDSTSPFLSSEITEKKEVSDSRTYKSVHVQTYLETNILERAKIKLKESKTVEVQTNILLASACVQTNVTLQNYDKEVRSPNYLNYVLKLKKIDEEIGKLLESKRILYKTIEDEYKSMQSDDILNIQGKGEQRICNKEGVAVVPPRKHKKTDSDNEFDDSMHNPKRKKRHRNSKKVSHSEISTYNKITDPVNEVIDSNRTESFRLNHTEISEDKRKPLSIKISLKNLKQSSPKQEFEDILKKRTTEVGTKKSISKSTAEDKVISDDIKQDLYLAKLSKRTTDKKLDCEDTKVSKTSVAQNSPNSDNEITHTADQHIEERHSKTNKSKKLKAIKHDFYNLKLPDQEKIVNKKCHVVIERCTIEYLENLKRKIHDKSESSKHVFSDIPPHQEISESEIISNTICDKVDLEFQDFLGAVLDIKVVQEVLLAATDSGNLYFFNASTGDVINSLSISEKPLTSIYTSINDQECNIYVGCVMGVLTTLDFTLKKISSSIQCEESIQCLEKEWEYIFMGSHKGLVMRYNFKKHKLEMSLKIYDSNILAIKATQEGARRVLIVASRSTEVTVRDAMSGLLLRTMDSSFYPTVYTMLLINNSVYCGTSQHDILVFTFQDGQLRFKYDAVNSKGVVCLKVTGDLLFAGCYNGNIYVYSISSKKYLGQIAETGGMLLSMDIHENKIFVGTKANKLKRLTIPEALLNETS